MVDKASGSRRVRKSVDACRYVLDMCDEEFLAEEMDEDSDDMEADMIWDEEERLSARVALTPEWEPFVEAIVMIDRAAEIVLYAL
jgi:hypothetical protein